jgi:hypothetical protein
MINKIEMLLKVSLKTEEALFLVMCDPSKNEL